MSKMLSKAMPYKTVSKALGKSELTSSSVLKQIEFSYTL